MDDLSEKLAGILNDPESLNKIKKMSESLFGGEEEKPSLPSAYGGLSDIPDAEDMKKIIGIMSRLKAESNDSRTMLLKALKPNLSEKRQERVDRAIKILKIIELLPYLKESGILNIL